MKTLSRLLNILLVSVIVNIGILFDIYSMYIRIKFVFYRINHELTTNLIRIYYKFNIDEITTCNSTGSFYYMPAAIRRYLLWRNGPFFQKVMHNLLYKLFKNGFFCGANVIYNIMILDAPHADPATKPSLRAQQSNLTLSCSCLQLDI